MEKNAHNISQDEFNSLIKKTFSGDLIDPRYWSKSNLDDFIKKLEITKSLSKKKFIQKYLILL